MKNKLEFDYRKNIVTKNFISRIDFDREKAVYEIMQDSCYVPKIFDIYDLTIKFSYFVGETFSEIVRGTDYYKISFAFEILIDSLSDFERIYREKTKKRIKFNDFNPRNCMFDGKKVQFIDFEDTEDTNDNLYSNWAALLGMIENCNFSDEAIKKELYENIVQKISSKYNIDIKTIKIQAEGYINLSKDKRSMYRITNLIDCAILAGGKSTRMEGKTKGLLNLGEYTFCDYIIHSMKCFDNVFISANLAQYNQFNIPVVEDTFIDIGPLSGIYSALSNTEKDWVFVIPCDMPFVSQKLIKFAVKLCDFTAKDAIIFHCNGREYPTVAFYNKRILPKLHKKIADQDYKIKNLLSELNCQYIDVTFIDEMVNINTPEEYLKAVEYHKK